MSLLGSDIEWVVSLDEVALRRGKVSSTTADSAGVHFRQLGEICRSSPPD